MTSPKSKERILIVEDDPALLRGLTDNFAFEGYHVLTAPDGTAGLHAALDAKPDLILLDIMLPGINGYEICRRVRDAKIDVPILMLTAKGQEADIILGLNLGADDYITKPFSIKELLARTRAFLRRRATQQVPTLAFAGFTLDFAGKRLLNAQGCTVELTPKEYGVLETLARRPGRAFTRDELLNRVWGHGIFVAGRSVDRCITTLRAKIEPEPAHPRLIHTLRDVGYRFEDTTA